jgi:glutamate carboxypeptidase
MKKARTVKPSRSKQSSSAVQYFAKRTTDIVETIRQLVEIESPSDVKQAVDRLSTILTGRFEELGGRVTLHRSEKYGNHLQADFRGAQKSKPVLLLGHMDTVYPIGAISKMRCHEAKGRLWGPGVLDMKSGIALMLAAIESLRSNSGGDEGILPRPVTVFLVSDEEVGSPSSRKITEALAKKSAAVFVMEPAYGLHGAVKTERKGVGEYTIRVTGKAAHSGLDFEKGQSAILELAKQINAISNLVDARHGLTLNVGTVRGGTKVNVVPGSAEAAIDVRITRNSDGARIDRKLRAIRPFNKQCHIEIRGGINRPPMERTKGVAALYQQAVKIAKELGWKLQEASVGGGSDGNFTTALGISTLDGMGGVGDGAHAEHEHVLISELPKRAALLAKLIESV